MRLIIAGGGTGGHLFPGVALAEELRSRDPASAVRFVGTARGIEARVLPELGWELVLIEVSGLKTVGATGALRGLVRLPRALWQARRVVRDFDPDVVVGVGGYASGPVVLMARLMGVKTAILEQNSLPGLANKILGRFVHAVFLAFAETRRFFKPGKILMTGNPIRRDILLALQASSPASASASASASSGPASGSAGAAEPLRLFAFGGSQGAAALNQIVADAAGLLSARGVGVDVVHQTGEAHLEATRARYQAAGASADLRPFIKDMAAEYRRADLVIARAGATTVAELGVVGRPAILVPYPFAADNHQEINAREMADAGAALMFRQSELSPEVLADAVADLAAHRERLAHMGSAMKALGKPGAAAAILDWCSSGGPAHR
ncbi:MAG TPA: undecaprenyldiphospho-muramoylpentapeptide beta-N-acetylglucosaminyltransferase [Kofleriaceae bacterium]|nr:undecaprenyldiphospho-muramoylpentapeptide beta-N-acetylglucosaminyltransferase [Kofleriaceae bacterium]